MNDILKQNRRFVQEMKQRNKDYFLNLSKGQSPEIFLISCTDSRVSPSVILQMPLGKLFVHRNVANQVNENDDSFNASLYYALKHLKVKKIVILGHTGCGGIQAAQHCNSTDSFEVNSFGNWITHIQQSIKGHKNDSELLEKENVIQQMKKLKAHSIYEEYGNSVEIEGYLLHLETGELELL
ncbi:carbonic anhydrase [Alkalihalobacterium chitinilyticum]|uniref:carbonic anhydrase n=1 Tax=Alkalihalobacterium chitinilyticum TaxID=2980103 RepID=A0ABT5VDS4_9BACI|nr:carbonic anhydrase [Alkalihalobacterium chitinilyticum]MDE5413415.1 carbonate dehydratase [Alkalihalobacterium chitinilyticum]